MAVKSYLNSIVRGTRSLRLNKFQDFAELMTEAARVQSELTEPARGPTIQRNPDAGGMGQALPGMGNPLGQALIRNANLRNEIQVGDRVYRLSRPADQAALLAGLQAGCQANRQTQGFAQEIICHQYRETAPVCISINTDTHLPSFAEAHVEHWPESSYTTHFFDAPVNGRLTRIQLWKGHLLALNMSGAEISLWQPDTRHVLRCSGFLDCHWVDEEYFGPFWFPYVKNQAFISWDLIERASGATLLGFGRDSAYEQEAKWWAGKWIDHSAASSASKKGEDYLIRYAVRDTSGIVAQGEW